MTCPGCRAYRGMDGSVVAVECTGACDPDRDVPRLMELYLEGKLPLGRLITKRYSLDHINEALEDLAHGRIFRVSPAGEWSLFHQYAGRPNGLKLAPDGRIVVADAVNGILSFDPRTREARVVLAEYGGRRLLGPNDLTFAAIGDLYFTDPGTRDLRRPNGRVFRIRANGEVELLLDGLAYPNGLVLSVKSF